MSLVEYSDSDSDDDEVDINTNNSIRDNDDSDGDEKLQPPAKFLQLYKTNPKLSPNPAFHQGKTRSIAHIDGSWPCFVSLEWDLTKKQLTQLDSTLKSVEIEINQPIHRLFYSELHVPQPLHVSLTSTLMIRQEDLKEFEAEIIRSIKQTKSGTDQLEISFESIAVLSNETKTRSFVVMVIDPESSSKIHKLVAEFNKRIKQFNQPQFTCIPHVSIGWFLNSTNTKPTVPSPNIRTQFSSVTLKIGKNAKLLPI